MAILLALYLAFVAFLAWALACNCKCHGDRIGLIGDVAAANTNSGFTKSYWHLLDAVSYERHFRRLLTFRDPWAIYPPELAEVRVAK